MMRLAIAVSIAVVAVASAPMPAMAGQSSAAGPVVLVDSTGKVAARPLNETVMLVNVDGIPSPAFLRPIYGADGRAASGSATWQSGGSVLFTSPDCSTGAHVFSPGTAGLRATAQVQTPDGIVLFVGAAGATTMVAVQSILYGSGCSPVSVQQNGLVAVEASINLTTAYPPPLSFQ